MTDLDDAAAIELADVSGVLRAAALGGAQVRATAEAVSEQALSPLDGLRPRSVVFITGGGQAPRAAALLATALGGVAGLPIVATAAAPPWAGPLDVLVVAGDDAGDPALVEAAELGARRGAEVVVAVPDEGPMRAAAAGRTVKLPPRVPVPGVNAFLRHLAVGIAVLRMVDPARAGALMPGLEQLADLLDAEAARNNPAHEAFGNPAKSLAARMHNRGVVLAGDGPAATVAAMHAADVMLSLAGVAAGAAGLDAAVAAAAVQRAATPAVDPVFYDEQFDGPPPRERVRTFVLSAALDQAVVRRRMAVLTDADLLVAEAAPDGPGTPPSELAQLGVLCLRLEMTAAYLRLLDGATG